MPEDSTPLDATLGLEHKAAPIADIQVVDEDKGIVEAYVSVTGVLDRVGDIIEPGAYTKALAERTPHGVWSHNWDQRISKTLKAEELMPGDPRLPEPIREKKGGGLLVQTQFNLNTTRGRDAYEDVKFFGPDQEWSIGYKATKATRGKDGIRRIKELALFEYSPVLHGAMPLAKNVSVKSAQEAWAAAREILDRAVIVDEDVTPEVTLPRFRPRG